MGTYGPLSQNGGSSLAYTHGPEGQVITAQHRAWKDSAFAASNGNCIEVSNITTSAAFAEAAAARKLDKRVPYKTQGTTLLDHPDTPKIGTSRAHTSIHSAQPQFNSSHSSPAQHELTGNRPGPLPSAISISPKCHQGALMSASDETAAMAAAYFFDDDSHRPEVHPELLTAHHRSQPGNALLHQPTAQHALQPLPRSLLRNLLQNGKQPQCLPTGFDCALSCSMQANLQAAGTSSAVSGQQHAQVLPLPAPLTWASALSSLQPSGSCLPM